MLPHGRFFPNTIYYKNTLVASELEPGSRPQDITFFDPSFIVAATDNFSPTNKLGQGGFGTVYEGRLSNGKDVAVKRLSANSGQGIEELKNEVMLIAKLQHRNLVKLLGCCIEGGEQMLIYQYLLNKSLDSFLFNKTRKAVLDWKKRFDIIIGIARGILYLHQDSRLTIIHRDLKCSNILLDANMIQRFQILAWLEYSGRIKFSREDKQSCRDIWLHAPRVYIFRKIFNKIRCF